MRFGVSTLTSLVQPRGAPSKVPSQPPTFGVLDLGSDPRLIQKSPQGHFGQFLSTYPNPLWLYPQVIQHVGTRASLLTNPVGDPS